MKAIARLLAAACCLTVTPSAFPQTWPTKPIKIVVPLSAGSSSDQVVRMIAPKLSEALNQPDGSQIDEYEADGIHMQPVGYTAWCNYLATHTAWDRRNTYAGENPLYILGS